MTHIEIYHGDSACKLTSMDSEKIHLVVTSPPYDNLREYNGNNAWDFENTARQLYRVLVPGGVVCWNVNDSVVDGCETLTSFRQAIFFKDQIGFNVHDTMIYAKSNGSKPDATRYNSGFEYVFILSKGKPRVFNPIKDKRNVTFGKPCAGLHTMRERDGSMSVRKDRKIAAEFGNRSNVWFGNTRGQEEMCKNLPHPAMMPMWLARDLIKSFSNEGDIVLDPFAGSGSVGWEARRTGRNAVLIDVDKHAIQIMRRKQKLLQPELV